MMVVRAGMQNHLRVSITLFYFRALVSHT